MRFPFPRLSAAATASLALALLSCSNGTTARDTVTVSADADFSATNVYAVDFSNADQVDLTLTGLSGKTLILAKINKGSSAASATATGSAALTSVVAASTRASSRSADLSATTTGTTRPPRRPHPIRQLTDSNTSSLRSASTRSVTAATTTISYGVNRDGYTPGSKEETFWVDKYVSGSYQFDEMTATLARVTTHAYIWVANSSTTNNGTMTSAFDMSSLSSDMLDLLAYSFEQVVFPYTTTVCDGFENGGGTGGDGGVDKDQHINILIFDIDFDNNGPTDSFTAGYFWGSKDIDSTSYSNRSEIFYLDACGLNMYPYTIVSTLAHEYQHMIGYSNGRSGNTWLDELRSLATEDLLAPAFAQFSANNDYSASGIDAYDYFSDGPGYWALYYNLYYPYAAGLNAWGGTTDDYAYASMLANYLHRAYGGKAFMMDQIAATQGKNVSLASNVDSGLWNAISSAFTRTAATDGTAPAAGAASDLTSFFSGILEPFAYALWGLGADGTAGTSPFIRADAQAAASLALDAFTTRNSNTTIIHFPLPTSLPSSYRTTTINPGCYDIAATYAIPAYSFTFHTNASLQNIDSATLTLTAPNDADVEYRLIAIE